MSKEIAHKGGEVAKTLDELEKARLEGVLENLVCLVDYSGSMHGMLKADHKRTKIQAERDALQGLWEKTHWDLCEFSVFAFDDNPIAVECSENQAPQIPDPQGGTNFDSPIAAALEKNPTRIILCSDGQSSYPDKQIGQCQELGIPVDTIFIQGEGIYEEGGETLLRKISEETGGQFTTVDNAEDLSSVFAQLETTERLLLTDQSSDDPIEL
jgi:hypothetical protein